MITFMSCSMRKTVMPMPRMAWMSVTIPAVSCGFMPAVGSSSSKSRGSETSARAISSRRRLA